MKVKNVCQSFQSVLFLGMCNMWHRNTDYISSYSKVEIVSSYFRSEENYVEK